MIPANARPAHRRLRQKLNEIQEWNESCDLNEVTDGDKALGIITSGISFMHAREAAPSARILKLGLTHPLPMQKMVEFARSVERCVVIEEGDPCLVESHRAAGVAAEGKSEMYPLANSTGRESRAFWPGTTAPSLFDRQSSPATV